MQSLGMDETMLKEIELIARGIRERVLAHTIKNNGGYMSQACSSAEILASLYGGALNFHQIDSPIAPPRFIGVPKSGEDTYRTGGQFHVCN